MPPYQNQLNKYDRPPEPGNPSRTEAWALIEAAKRMAAAITQGPDDDKETREARKGALRLNWRLWTIFQAELSQERIDMAPELHRNMLTLCQFVDKHTVGAIFEPTAENMTVLIDINRNIASGLMDVPDVPEEDAPTEDKIESNSQEQIPPSSFSTEA